MNDNYRLKGCQSTVYFVSKLNKDKTLSLTEKELKILNFLNIEKKEITIDKLQIEVWGHKSKLDTHTVETHVYRLRKKVESKFKDKSFILSLSLIHI